MVAGYTHSWLAGSCVRKTFELPDSVGSFKVHIAQVENGRLPAECHTETSQACERMRACLDDGSLGLSSDCPFEFPERESPVRLQVWAEALDRLGTFMPTFAGGVNISIRPGKLVGEGLGGTTLDFRAGVSQLLSLEIIHSHGQARIWVEDCGTAEAVGSFATGVSEPLWFSGPTLTQIQRTQDNTTSPLVPSRPDPCSIAADQRYGIATDEDGTARYIGPIYDGEGKLLDDAGPPLLGQFLIVERGELVVTALDNSGFFVTDIAPIDPRDGFNHIYVFNFNYPDGLIVGDRLTRLRGSPIEFTGTTQLQQPSWERAPRDPAASMPAPVHIPAALYASSIRTYGQNRSEQLALERLESALVCMDNLAPARRFRIDLPQFALEQSSNCDVTNSGGVNRGGTFVGNAPIGELDISPELAAACQLTGYIPANPAEYCCERACFIDFGCTEQSSFIVYGQWAAEVYGRYDSADDPTAPSTPIKIAITTRDAAPDFDPLAFGAQQAAKPIGERSTLKVVGNLRHVLAARPVWVLIARGPNDIEIDGSCD